MTTNTNPTPSTTTYNVVHHYSEGGAIVRTVKSTHVSLDEARAAYDALRARGMSRIVIVWHTNPSPVAPRRLKRLSPAAAARFERFLNTAAGERYLRDTRGRVAQPGEESEQWEQDAENRRTTVWNDDDETISTGHTLRK